MLFTILVVQFCRIDAAPDNHMLPTTYVLYNCSHGVAPSIETREPSVSVGVIKGRTYTWTSIATEKQKRISIFEDFSALLCFAQSGPVGGHADVGHPRRNLGRVRRRMTISSNGWPPHRKYRPEHCWSKSRCYTRILGVQNTPGKTVKWREIYVRKLL